MNGATDFVEATVAPGDGNRNSLGQAGCSRSRPGAINIVAAAGTWFVAQRSSMPISHDLDDRRYLKPWRGHSLVT